MVVSGSRLSDNTIKVVDQNWILPDFTALSANATMHQISVKASKVSCCCQVGDLSMTRMAGGVNTFALKQIENIFSFLLKYFHKFDDWCNCSFVVAMMQTKVKKLPKLQAFYVGKSPFR